MLYGRPGAQLGGFFRIGRRITFGAREHCHFRAGRAIRFVAIAPLRK